MLLKSKIKKKLGNRAGETIGETLISLLISVLAITMFAGAIMSALNMVKTGRAALNTYYDNTNNLAAIQGTVKTGTITVEDETCDIVYAENTFGNTKVIAYKPSEE